MILIKNMNNFHIRIKMTSAHEGQAAEEAKVRPWGGKSTGDNRKAHCQTYLPLSIDGQLVVEHHAPANKQRE